MSNRRRWKRFGLISLIAVVGLSAFCFATNRTVLASADGRVYTSTSLIPNEPVGLVLGAAPTINGFINPFFQHRIDAAAALFKAGKVERLLVSGDNGRTTYDEPTAMRDALVAQGVPSKAIVLDYAGFRTLDSIVRAREIFGVTHCTIITDDFHLPRALYIAAEQSVDAQGFQSSPVDRAYSPWTYVRELSARTLTWVDMRMNRQPKFLGRKEPIRI